MHWLLLLSLAAASSAGRPRCGGVLTAARGILQTPSFPRALPVPIHCEWVIDAQHFTAPNTSIVVYLTQLYVHEGLTFTEYQVYDRTYQLDGKVVHQVNESNAVQVRWVQSFQSYLVVTLRLDTVDSVHLRVLDRFLDVYGFNITYEIVRGAVRPQSCTMMDCGFTGICYDHYTKFSCDCFPGYSGPHCSSGPSSFCSSGGGTPTCKNGGTCIHVGVSAVKCHCQKGYTGETCQTPISPPKNNDCTNCLMSCPFDGKLENACKCKSSSNTNIDKVGFTCTMHLSNLPSLQADALKLFIANQVGRTLKSNYTKFEDISVENVEYFRSGADVTFHLFAVRKDEKRIRIILGKWADRGYIANLTVADKEFVFRPLLDLQSVSINQIGTIRQHDEFILSCVARGSPSMSYRWFKDHVFVNVTEVTSHKWSRLIKDPHLEDQYTALLGVERADILDGGIFTCQVEDFGVQQCLSRRVQIKANPIIKVEPQSLTVRKGENFTVKCISSSNSNSKLTYSWTKNKELIPVRSDSEKYEILYPGGSILQVFHVEKSVKYSCLVQDDTTSSEVSVRVHVVDPQVVTTCAPNKVLNVSWPETAPDTDSLQECPKGYAFPGFVRRSCSLNDGLRPIWRQPDYSHCTSEPLHNIGMDIQLLRLGYEIATPLEIVARCRDYLTTKSGGLLPGEGTRILMILKDIVEYSKKAQFFNTNLTSIAFDLIDKVLKTSNSLVDQEQIKLLQEVVSQQIQSSTFYLSTQTNFTHLKYPTINIYLSRAEDLIHIPFINKSNGFGSQITSTIVQFKSVNPNSILGVVTYTNLTTFFPTRSVIRLRDGSEVEYELVSQIVRMWLFAREISHTKVVTDWYNEYHENTTKDGWYLKCAMAETALYAYSWNTSACDTLVLNGTTTRCICPNTGTYALLLTTNNIQVEKEEAQPRRYVVLAGCSLCFLSGLLCTIILITHWIFKRSCIVFLKLQCSISITGLMLIFVWVTIGEPPERIFGNVMALIESFLLMGLSAHVSTLLMVYTELVQLPKTASSKQTVIGISTGVPVIAVFGNHLAHRTMDVRLRSWWLLTGTLAFNIFLTVSAVIVALFLLLYFSVVGKLKKLTALNGKDGKLFQKRIVLLRRSACVFAALVIVTISSVIYVNYCEVVWLHYEFGISAMFLGLTIMLSYVLKSETEFYYLFHGNLKNKQKEGLCGVESTGSPLNFFTKEEAEVESESIPHQPVESFPMVDTCKPGLPECVSYTDAIYCAQTSLRNDAIERYNRSPQPYRKNITFKIDEEPDRSRGRSPDIIASKICTELDLVASHAPSIIITPEESIAKILKEEEWTCRAQPEGTEDIVTVSEKVDLEDNNLDGMLDRISHDLDYLLNRSDGDIATISGVPRKLSIGVIQEEAEEEDDIKVPESITDILRTNC